MLLVMLLVNKHLGLLLIVQLVAKVLAQNSDFVRKRERERERERATQGGA